MHYKTRSFILTDYHQIYIYNDGSKPEKGLGKCSWPGNIMLLLYYLSVYLSVCKYYSILLHIYYILYLIIILCLLYVHEKFLLHVKYLQLKLRTQTATNI